MDLLCFCSVLCLLCFVRVCLYVLRGHLLGKVWPLGSRLWCLMLVCHFPIGILGQVWYLIVSIPDLCNLTYFYNETHDPKGQENKIYTIVNGREMFYRRHTVPVTSCSEVKCVLKRVSFGSKDCTKELKLECAYFLGQTSWFLPFRRHQWPSNSFKVLQWNPWSQRTRK